MTAHWMHIFQNIGHHLTYTYQKRVSLHRYKSMQTKKTPFRAAAESGQTFGIYLSLIFLGMVLSSHLSILGFLSIVLLLSFPYVMYRYIKRYSFVAQSVTQSSLSIMGIMMTFYGSLICSIVTMAYLTWINPTFIADTVKTVVVFYSSLGTPEATKIARGFSRMIDEGLIPNATAFTATMATYTLMLGAILSIVCSAIVLYLHKRASMAQLLSRINQPDKSQY